MYCPRMHGITFHAKRVGWAVWGVMGYMWRGEGALEKEVWFHGEMAGAGSDSESRNIRKLCQSKTSTLVPPPKMVLDKDTS